MTRDTISNMVKARNRNVNDDYQFDQLTSRELSELRAEVETAIRAAIRAKQAKTVASPSPTTTPAPKMDLERERDAWLSAKQQKGRTL